MLSKNFKRMGRRAQAREVLRLLPQMREVQRSIGTDPRLPKGIELPNGEVIDMLDGETEKLFDMLEAVCLRVLVGGPSGRA